MASVNSIYGLFADPDAADRGVNALRHAGVAQEQIVVMSSEPHEGRAFSLLDHKTVMPWLAALGGVVGGSCGFLLARYTQVAYPQPLITGGMPLVAPFPSGIVTYELTMMGAVLTTVITLLIASRLPKWKQPLYDPEVSYGKILVGVLGPSGAARADLEKRLRGAGAEKVKTTGPL